MLSTNWRDSDSDESRDHLLSEHEAVPCPGCQKANVLKTRRLCLTGWVALAIFFPLVMLIPFARRGLHIVKADSISDELTTAQFEWEKFPNFKERSVYQGYPTEELELAWSNLLNKDVPKWLEIPLDRLPALNKTPTHPAGYTWHRVEDGKGSKIEAVTELWHQLHCLDLVRKYMDRDRWDYSEHHEWKWGPDRLREHAEHCVDIIRIAIICHGDMTPLLEYENDGQVWLDFETWHQCRRFN